MSYLNITKLLGIESPTNTWKWCLKYPKWIKTIKTGHLLTISHPPNPSVHLALAGMIMETTCPGTYPVYPPPTVPARRSSAIPATKDGTKLPWSCCVDLWMDDRTLRTPENPGCQWYEISRLQVWMPYSKWWAEARPPSKSSGDHSTTRIASTWGVITYGFTMIYPTTATTVWAYESIGGCIGM